MIQFFENKSIWQTISFFHIPFQIHCLPRIPSVQTIDFSFASFVICLPFLLSKSKTIPNKVGGNAILAEDSTRKREIRLQKNREAARECRRKKKEYIKCLENRVAVLENQNKALIEELKSLKELYCQQKTD